MREYCKRGCGRKVDEEYPNRELCSECLMEEWEQESFIENYMYERSVR